MPKVPLRHNRAIDTKLDSCFTGDVSKGTVPQTHEIPIDLQTLVPLGLVAFGAKDTAGTVSFPMRKGIDAFDFSFHPSIDKRQIDELCTMHFLENAENIVFLGPPGVGKTHLASALGMETAKHRFSTYYINCTVIHIKGESYRLKERKEYMKQKVQITKTLFENASS